MKRLIKIVGTLCILLALSLSANAQWRFGFEVNAGANPGYTYDENGFFLRKDKYQRLLGQGNFMADYLLPRRWTPNYLALSMRIGLGGMYVTDSSCFNLEEFESNKKRTQAWISGISIPLELEVKYLISNSTRLYVNGGINSLVSIDGKAVNFEDRDVMIGYQFGVGLEFHNFRIGYKNISMTKTISQAEDYPEEEFGNKLKSAHSLTIGFWFNGNRTLKKYSILKAY